MFSCNASIIGHHSVVLGNRCKRQAFARHGCGRLAPALGYVINMTCPLVLAIALAAVTFGCGSRRPELAQTAVENLLAATPLIDGHNDLLIHYVAHDGKTFKSSNSYDFTRQSTWQTDLQRLRKGRVGAAIFTTAILDDHDRQESIKQSTGALKELGRQHPSDLEIVTTSSGLLRAFGAGRIAVLMGLEGGDQIGRELEMFDVLFRHGVRAMTLVWEKTNEIGDSNADAALHGGLSVFGGDVVRSMNRLGMLVDLLHAADANASDVLAVTKAPVIFSHSSARALCPTTRNISDEMLKAVAANGGIVMVSFVPYFTTPEYRLWYDRGEAHWAELNRRHKGDKAAVAKGMAAWDAENPQPTVTIQDVADHVEHIRQVAGLDHVGLGSDFEGMGTFQVKGLEDVSTFPALLQELASRSWTENDLAKLAGGNFLRVFAR